MKPKYRANLKGRTFLGFKVVKATDLKSVEMATGLALSTGSNGATYTDGLKSAEVTAIK